MKKTLLIILLFSLTGCQQTAKKTTKLNDINAILTNITIDALKDEDIQLATRSINAIILSNDDQSWDFIQSALISLPKEVTSKVIDSALTLDSVKKSPVQLFAIAKVYISRQQTKKALMTINQAIALDNNNLDARYWRARLLTIMKDYESAESDFIYIIKKDADNEDYSSQYASYLQETSQFDKAQKILSKQKVTPDGLFKRIVFALQNDDTETANGLYKTLKDLKVSDERTNHKTFLTAESAYWLKKPSESEKYYRLVKGGKHYLEARDMLSLILFEDKRYAESIEMLRQLQNAEEKYAIKAYRLESQINKEQGDPQEAITTLSRSLKMLPNNPDLLYDRAMLYESQNKLDKVESDLLQIIKDDPDNFEALNALGYSLADHDLKLEKAYEYIQKAINLAPENPAIMDSLGWVQYKLGKYDEAEVNFNKALDKDISDPELYIHLYKTLVKLGKHISANELIQKAKMLFPDNAKLSEIK